MPCLLLKFAFNNCANLEFMPTKTPGLSASARHCVNQFRFLIGNCHRSAKN
jgi:hypothetical protein